ncbi:MAG: bifunctional homocysteine S-methyltransferase/methylenetetrahydrofolate reductase [Lachnospiraceae bacterium]|nr:bifunctional homocysteine S-methyltransferase/methylenetetrahydrofolate reductase [Lachnospiraceae bacterium]
MKLKDFLQENILLMDGAMGTYYQQLQENKENVAELANLSQPEVILNIHKEYLAAGADIIRTNTFAVNSVVLPQMDNTEKEDLLRRGCCIAKQAVEEEKLRTGRECFVAADIGPIAASGETNAEDILSEYYRICDVFLSEGMDIFWLETFSSTEFVQDILEYIKKKAPEAFCSVSFCINKNGYTTAGQKAERLLFSDKLALVDAIGFNCGIGSVHMKSILAKCRLPKDVFVLAAPNAGYAETFSSRAAFLNSAGYFGDNMAQIAGLGIDIVGGCCGTMPSFIREMRKKISGKQSVERISKEEYERFIAETKKSAVSTGTGQEDNRPETGGNNKLKEKLLRGEKVIAVELDPPYNADGEKLLACAKTLSKYPVDVLTFADSPMGRSRADSTLTALHINSGTGMQVIPHVCCRDRNVIAMRSLLLGAHMNGLRNLLIVTGDPVPGDDRKTVTGVFDYNSIRFMKYVTEMNQELFPEDGFFFGGALNYNFPNGEKVAERMEKKMEAGCSFFLTQPIFSDGDVERIQWLKERTGAKILAGILPPVSLKNASFIRNEMAGMNVPDEVINRYREDMTREEGETVGAEIAKELMKKLEHHVDGYYFMLPFNRVGLMERILGE